MCFGEPVQGLSSNDSSCVTHVCFLVHRQEALALLQQGDYSDFTKGVAIGREVRHVCPTQVPQTHPGMNSWFCYTPKQKFAIPDDMA